MKKIRCLIILTLLKSNENIVMGHQIGQHVAIHHKKLKSNIKVSQYLYSVTGNNVEDMNILRPEEIIKHIWKNTKKLYNKATRLQNLGIGGRSGNPESYCDFEQHTDKNFSRYDSQYGVALPYIFILNMTKGEHLKAETYLLPDGGTESEFSGLTNSSPSRSNFPSTKNNCTLDVPEIMSTVTTDNMKDTEP